MDSAHAWRLAVDVRFSTSAAPRAAFASVLERGPAPISSRSASVRGFQRAQRLVKPAEFTRVFAKAARSSDRYFTILACPGTEASARLGLTISRRAAKRSVDRNMLKRLVRESFRHQTLPAWDFVVIAKPGAAAADRAALRQSVDDHFRRLSRRAVAD